MARITLYSFGSQRELEVPEGCTVENLVALADLSPDIEIRISGERISPEQRAERVVNDGDVVNATAAEVKQAA